MPSKKLNDVEFIRGILFKLFDRSSEEYIKGIKRGELVDLFNNVAMLKIGKNSKLSQMMAIPWSIIGTQIDKILT